MYVQKLLSHYNAKYLINKCTYGAPFILFYGARTIYHVISSKLISRQKLEALVFVWYALLGNWILFYPKQRIVFNARMPEIERITTEKVHFKIFH